MNGEGVLETRLRVTDSGHLRPIRVLHCRSSRGRYGPERVISELAAPLAEHGVSTQLVVLYRPGRGDPAVHPWVSESQARGLVCDQVLDPAAFSLRTLQRLTRRILAAQPDLVHTHDYRSNLLGGLAVRRRRPSLAWIATVHLHTATTRRLRVYRTLDLLLLRLADQVITVSRDQRRLLLARGVDRRRLHLVPPALSVERFGREITSPVRVRARFGLPLDGPVVTLVGRLTPQKGADLFLAAARQVHEAFPEAHFLVVGDGPQRLMLQLAARQLGIGDVVSFLGYQSDVASLLGASAVVVLPSRSEGLPVALLEAMAMGRPIVASAVGGIPELIRDGLTGLLVPAEDTAGLASAIVRLLSEPELAQRLGAAAQDHVRHHCNAARAAERLTAIYRQTLVERSACTSP